MQDFLVKQESFEGPLDLLLSLIEKRKLFINDISLSKVADDYIGHIKAFSDFPIAESADFVLIASTLVLIKSRSLLPSLQLSAEEETSISDLELRLKLYKRFKEIAQNLRGIYGKNIMFFVNTPPRTPIFSPHSSITKENLLLSIRKVIALLPSFERLPEAVVKKVVSLEDMIKDLSKRVSENLKMSFKEFSSLNKKDKVHIIVSFLAILELIRLKEIKAVQKRIFSDIEIIRNKDNMIPVDQKQEAND